MSDGLFIQLFNVDNDPVFLDIEQGSANWTLPEELLLNKVRFISHHTENGMAYYEDIFSNEVSWALPDCLSEAATAAALTLLAADASLTEQIIGQIRPEGEAGLYQLDILDNYLNGLEGQEFAVANEGGDDYEGEVTTTRATLSAIMERESIRMEGVDVSTLRKSFTVADAQLYQELDELNHGAAHGEGATSEELNRQRSDEPPPASAVEQLFSAAERPAEVTSEIAEASEMKGEQAADAHADNDHLRPDSAKLSWRSTSATSVDSTRTSSLRIGDSADSADAAATATTTATAASSHSSAGVSSAMESLLRAVMVRVE